jgi:acyl dehydratase
VLQPWFEDLYPGYSVVSDPRLVTQEEIVAFATLWDPQPYHLDPEAAEHSVFGQLVGSGTHMHALMMRLGFDSGVLCGNAELGLGLDEMRFLKPLLPDRAVTATFMVLSARASKSRPGHGVVAWRVELLDDAGAVMFSAILTNLYRRRP